MNKLKWFTAVLILILSNATHAFTGQESQDNMTIESFLASLNFQRGTIVLNQGLVTLSLPDSYRYLSPEDTEKVLVDAWGNPPGNETMGMIVPEDVSLFSDEGWGVIISYEEDGYVSDEDAENINYDELLQQMREASDEENKLRAEEGYEPIEFIGWAEKPSYDNEAHKLYWAKELRFGTSEANTLNYNIRILGRKGVLLLNIVSSMVQYQAINSQIPSLLSMTEFNQGNKYSDFTPGVDKVAAYGIGALIAGKVASKVGLFAKFGSILVVLKKVWIAIAIAIGALFKKIFAKKE